MELSAELLFVLGIASSVIVWLLKEIFVKPGKAIPTWVYSIALGGIALALAVAFMPVVLPPVPAHDGTFLGILVAALSFLAESLPVIFAVVGFARIIYEVLLQRVLDGLGQKVKSLFGGADTA